MSRLIIIAPILLILVSCTKSTLKKDYDEAQVVLEFAIKLEQEEINYKHTFEKSKKGNTSKE